MKLKKFTKNKKQKRIVIGSIVGILLLIGGISLYRTFAMYKVEKTFDVLNGTVPDFSSGDIQLAITVDGSKQDTIPTKNDKNYGVVVSCDHAKGSWDKDNWRAILESFTGSKVKCNLYFESTLSGYIKALSKVDESIIEEEHEETDQTPKLTDYRYVGATPNNYVCLESGECNEDQLYRIIGVIPTQKEDNDNYEDRVKLIKNTSYGKYTFSDANNISNGEWSQLVLNTQILNNNYWESIKMYQPYIDKAKWYLGNNDTHSNNAFQFYTRERINQMGYNFETYSIGNIGLFYGSDYLFATSGGSSISRDQCLKINNMSWASNTENDLYAECRNYDWLYDNSIDYWVINYGSFSGNGFYGMRLTKIGNIDNADLSRDPEYYLKPSFYLKKDVLYKSGDGTGTKENPYRISISNS